MLLSSGVVLVILLVLFVKNVQYTRTVREKNVGMAHTIQELLVYRDNLYRTEEELAAQKAENARLLKAASPASIAVVDKQEDTEREGTEQECEQEGPKKSPGLEMSQTQKAPETPGTPPQSPTRNWKKMQPCFASSTVWSRPKGCSPRKTSRVRA